MKKSVLAIALLTSFSAVSYAQSSVELYGIVDVGFRYTDTDEAVGSKTEMTHNVSQSRFGLRGSENLGGGINAIFKLENGFDIGSGNAGSSSKAFSRDAYFGFESNDFGLITFGRRGAASGAFDDLDPFWGSYANAAFGNVFVAYDAPRSNNSVRYTSPSMNGFTVGLSYSLTGDASDENPGAKNNTQAYAAMGQYKSGPLQIMVTYDYIDYKRTTLDSRAYGVNGVDVLDAKAVNSADFWQIGAAYNFDFMKLYVNYAKNDGIGRSRTYDAATGGVSLGGSNVFNPNVNRLVVGSDGTQRWVSESVSTDAWLIGATVPVGGGTAVFSYYAAPDWDIDAINIGYRYNITKRTELYSVFSHANNLDMQSDYSGKGSRNSVEKDITTNQFAFGIRHKF